MIEPALFLNVGWAERYDGSEKVVGNHRFLKKHGRDCSEAEAFRRVRGRYRCGSGSGVISKRGFDVVLVARDPTRGVHRIVGWYRGTRWEASDPEDPGRWGILIASEAKRLPVGERPTITWPGNMGMRRWTDQHPHLHSEYRRLISRKRTPGTSRSHPGMSTTPNVFVYRWGTNSQLWREAPSVSDALRDLRQTCAALNDDVAWPVGSGASPAGSKAIKVGDVLLVYAGRRFGPDSGIYGIAVAGSKTDTVGELATDTRSLTLPFRWLKCTRELAAQPIRDFDSALAPPGPAKTILRLKRVPPGLLGLIQRALAGGNLPQSKTRVPRKDLEELVKLLETTVPAVRSRLLAEVTRIVRDARLRPVVLAAWPTKCAACDLEIADADQYEVEVAHVREIHDEGPDSPSNAMPLCRTHHWAFDRGLWAIEPTSMRITVVTRMRRSPGLRSIHGRKVAPPVINDKNLLDLAHVAHRWKRFLATT